MGTKTRGWPRALAALLLVALLAGEAAAANYTEYANATLQNQLGQLRLQRDLYKFITDPYPMGWFAWLTAEIQTNQTMTQNWTVRLYSRLLETIGTDDGSQRNLNAAFQAVGMNASQVNCGDASGGDCRTLAGVKGRSRVANETIRLVRGNAGNAVTDMARLRAEMFKYWALWYVNVQKATVALIDSSSG